MMGRCSIFQKISTVLVQRFFQKLLELSPALVVRSKERAEIGLRYTVECTENLAEIVRTSLPTADMSRQILQSTLRE